MEQPDTYIQSVSSHLEFLGYTITKQDKGYRVQGSGVPRLFFFAERAGGLTFTTSYGLSENAATDRLGILEWLNQINALSDVIAVLVNKETTLLTFFAWFPGLYDKKHFGGFFTTFSTDIHRVARDERWNKYLQ